MITIIAALLSGVTQALSAFMYFSQGSKKVYCISERSFAYCKAFPIISRYMNTCIHDGINV